MTALVRCPLCGANEGYEASGDIMTCCSCLRGRVVVSRTHDEDVAEWNSAGAHAQSLRRHRREAVMANEQALKYRAGAPVRINMPRMREHDMRGEVCSYDPEAQWYAVELDKGPPWRGRYDAWELAPA